MEINTRTRKFIKDHSNDDIHILALKSDIYPEIDFKFAIKQISGRQGIINKIPAFYANENVLYPVKLSLEQTSSEPTAKYKASLFKGKSFVDLTGGFGCDCFFISRNFEKSVYVEKNEDLCEIAGHNFSALGASDIEILCSDAEEFLNGFSAKADLFYIDPARRSMSGEKTVSIADCTPDLTELSDLLVKKSENVLVKLSPLIDISLAIKELKYVSEVHVVSVENECKEVLFVLNQNPAEIMVCTTNFRKNDKQIFEYRLSDEGRAVALITEQLNTYLYEPNSAILKAGAFKIISSVYPVKKLDIHTHLYTSDVLIENFPGRIFKIENIYPFSKAGIKQLKTEISKANITVRNFPLSVKEIREKTGLKEGGKTYIFASGFRNEKLLIQCRKPEE